MSHAAKVLRAVRNSTRRQTYNSGGTKRLLLENATRLFGEHGYAGTSLDEVVAASAVTKGALYHHFPSKLALFESVYAQLQSDTVEHIRAIMARTTDPWERLEIGLAQYLQACRDPQYRRICIQEAPAALGHEHFREAERAATLGLVHQAVGTMLAELDLTELADAFAALMYGAVRSTAEFVADAEDPELASRQTERAMSALLTGMRRLRDDR